MKDHFNKVDKILKSPKYSEALNILLNLNGNRIVHPYNSDLNHAWYLVGVVYFKKENYIDALCAFKKSYHHYRDDVAAIRAIGNCYSGLENPKTAKYYFIKAINIGGKKYKDINILTYNLGNAYFDMKKYDLAISEYKKVKKSDKETFDLAQKNIKHVMDKKKRRKRGRGQTGSP